MTVSYIHRGPTSLVRWLFPTIFLFFTHWKGSIIKGIGFQFSFFSFAYAALSLFYRSVLVDSLGNPSLEWHKQRFERWCVKCHKGGAVLPLTFILGFFVTQVVNRWWSQYQALYWDNTLAFDLVGILPGPGRMERVRNQLIRLVNLSNILLLRGPSPRVFCRFPLLSSLTSSGLMTEAEAQLYTRQEMQLQEKNNNKELKREDKYQLTQLPLRWATNLLVKLNREKAFNGDLMFRTLQGDLNNISSQQNKLLGYIEVPVPLVYTQLVILAVNIYFAVALFGQQFLRPTKYIQAVGGWTAVEDEFAGDTENRVGYDENREDFYVPVFTLLKFIFYFGWLHVASVLIDPFGNDDEDFNLNMMINRNLETGFMIVKEPEEEEVQEDTPEMLAKWKVAVKKYCNEPQPKPKWKVSINKFLHVDQKCEELDKSMELESVGVQDDNTDNNDNEESNEMVLENDDSTSYIDNNNSDKLLLVAMENYDTDDNDKKRRRTKPDGCSEFVSVEVDDQLRQR